MTHPQKVVLITGCSSGFGFLTALKFAQNNFHTIATVRNRKRAQDLIKLSEKYPNLKIAQMDVTNAKEVQQIISTITKEVGRIDILVNNAGFGFLGPVEDFTLEEIREQYETNFFGVLSVTKAVLPLMKKQKSGSIINISSINGLISFPLYGIYCSSKFALEAMTTALRFELAPFGISVSLVEPGGFKTNFGQNTRLPALTKTPNSSYYTFSARFFAGFEGMKQKSGVLIGRVTKPERVVNKIFQLANMNNPPLHNKVGVDTHVYTFFRWLISDTLWEALLRRFYRWG